MLLHLRHITLHGVRSKSLKPGRHSHSIEADKCKQYRNIQMKAKMTESKDIKAIVNLVPIQAATAVVMVLIEADEGPR